MGLQLFNFVYNTLMQKANDNRPDNSLFLPVALSNMKQSDGTPYLPLKGNNWDLNNISGAVDISNDLAASWFNALMPQIIRLSQAKPGPQVTQQMIDDAQAAFTYIRTQNLNVKPYAGVGPDLNVSRIEIDGLANIQVSGQPPTVNSSNEGYAAQITLNLNAYPSTGQSWNEALALAGPEAGQDPATQPPTPFDGLGFTLTQCLCFVDKKGNVVAPPPTLGFTPSPRHANGFDSSSTGIALLTMGNAKVVSDTKVTVASGGKALQIALDTIRLTAVQGTVPAFTLQNLQYQSIAPVPFPSYIQTTAFYGPWSAFFKQVLSTNEASQMLTDQVNGALMDKGNRGQVQTLLNEQLDSAFNDIFGSTQVANSTVDTDANAVDKYLFNRARGALNDRNSYVYLPTLVLGSGSPVLEPYTATDLSIPGPFTTQVFGSVNISISAIVLQNLVIHGLSNVVVPPDNLRFGANQQANAKLLLGSMNPGPTVNVKGTPRTVPSPPATASTPFTLNVQVGQNAPIPLSGTLSLNLQNQSGTLGIQTSLTASGDTPQELQLTYSQIQLVAGDKDVALTITLSDTDAQYAAFINAFIGQSQLIEAIVSALNDYIGQNLSQISEAATRFARSALNNLGQ
ncbi:hypothetical protein M5C99_05455 [Acidovorax sp. NCPPB 2350]|nr:hypothetical protein M5C99_05455 [Acidovorax sp. NCPPB 2350]